MDTSTSKSHHQETFVGRSADMNGKSALMGWSRPATTKATKHSEGDHRDIDTEVDADIEIGIGAQGTTMDYPWRRSERKVSNWFIFFFLFRSPLAKEQLLRGRKKQKARKERHSLPSLVGK